MIKDRNLSYECSQDDDELGANLSLGVWGLIRQDQGQELINTIPILQVSSKEVNKQTSCISDVFKHPKVAWHLKLLKIRKKCIL